MIDAGHPREARAMPDPRDFFISYTGADTAWAEWIAWTLEEAGYSCTLQAWDFAVGSNFVLQMQQTAERCDRTLAVLSDAYLQSAYAAPEWAAAFVADPKGEARKLVPVRVADCKPKGLLGPIVSINLVGLTEPEARAALLGGFGPRRKPAGAPAFPGSAPSRVQSIPASFPGPAATMPRTPWNVPYPRNTFFTGREDILHRLHAALAARGATALTQAIAGLGGIGKTQTAVEYAYRHRDAYRAVLWARADSRSTLTTDFAAIAALLDLPEKDARDLDQVRAAVQRWLTDNGGYLLVLDNADEPSAVEPFVPLDPRGHILITTRADNLDQLNVGDLIELSVLPPDEAVEFLLKRARRKEVDPQERSAAEELARELGGLPLALEQASAYIAVHKVRFRDYLDEYRTLQLQLLEEQGPVAGAYRKTVRTTWRKSIDAVRKTSPAAADLLSATAFLGPDRIPDELIIKGAPELGETLAVALSYAEDGRPLRKLMQLLTRYSLIRRDVATRTCDVHRLVQAVIRDGMGTEMRGVWAERVVRAVARAYPGFQFSNWPQCERLLLHWGACASAIDQYQMEFAEASLLLNQAGYYLDDRAQYAAAEPLYRRALDITEKALGPEHPATATSLNNLAALYDSQGQYAAAEPLYRRALAIREKASGSEHPDTATSLNNLAALYASQGQYAAAEPLYRRALAIREKALGPEHPATATSLNNLAGLYKSQGQYAAAEPLYRRALDIWEKALGSEHPHTAMCCEGFADLLTQTGRTEDAADLRRRAAAIRAAHAKKNAGS
jgi:tetratricopeptide (TPR) repeat protein